MEQIKNTQVSSNNDKKSFAKGLLEFLKEYSVIGLAIGVIIAQTSKDLIDSIVRGLFTPLIDLMVPGEKFSNLAFSLAGARFDIGSIISSLMTFIIVMVILYVVVKGILKRDDLIKNK
jgi:large conductance mechanosensitive channel